MSKGCKGSDRCAGPLSYYPIVRLTYRESGENTPKLRGQHDLRWRLWIRLTPCFCRKRNEALVFSDKLVHTFFKG